MDAPKTINPDSRFFVIKSPDENGVVVAKYNSNSAVRVPESAGSFVAIEVASKADLNEFDYDHSQGFQH